MAAVAGAIIDAVANQDNGDSGGSGGSGISGILEGGAVGGLVGSIVDLIASNKSAEELTKAIEQARSYLEQGYTEAKGYYQPYYDQGTKDYVRLGEMIRGGEFDVSPEYFNYAPYKDVPAYQQQNFNFEADPGYQFRKQEGLNAINAAGAANGSLLSGATFKALSKYGSNLASQEYANAYGRYQDQRNFGYNRFLNDRSFSRANYDTDRGFAYGVLSDDYNRRRASAGDRYNRYNALANVGIGAAGNMANLSTMRAGDMANLGLQQGNVNAGKAQSYGNIIGGMAQMTIGGDMSGASAGNPYSQSGVQGSGQQYGNSVPMGYQAPTNYVNGVPNSNYNYMQGVDYDPYYYNDNVNNPDSEEEQLYGSEYA